MEPGIFARNKILKKKKWDMQLIQRHGVFEKIQYILYRYICSEILPMREALTLVYWYAK